VLLPRRKRKKVMARCSASWSPQPQVPASSYGPDYYDWHRWINYYWQFKTAIETRPLNVLEIGIGGSILKNMLRRFGIHAITLDIDRELSPEVVACVTALPFGDAEFDTVLCREVLEHMPYEESVRGLGEIRRVARRSALICVPNVGPSFGVVATLHRWVFPEVRIRLPNPKKLGHGGSHFWECGRPGFPLRRFRRDLLRSGFAIVSETGPPTSCYHAFFNLKVV